MELPADQRSPVVEKTLESMMAKLKEFQEKACGDLKKAKFYENVIHEPLFSIPIDPVILKLYFLIKTVASFCHSIGQNNNQDKMGTMKPMQSINFVLQICPPGLHISLGLFVKFYELLLDEVEDLDLKIVTKKAETDDNAGDTDFGQYVTLLQKARKHRQEASQYHRQTLEMHHASGRNW